MKVLFVVNNFYVKGNGLSASAQRTVQKLRESGLEVEVLSGPNPDPTGPEPMFLLQNATIPFFDGIVHKQGYQFAKTDLTIVKAAIEWADLIHIEEPFNIEITVCRLAEEAHKPMTATFHLYPENLFASVDLDKSAWYNGMMMRVWRDTVFNKCQIVQCPTANVRDRLEAFHFKSELRVISNGLVLEDLMHITPEEKAAMKRESSAPYQILAIGRLSKEKDYITLLKAMRYSRYAKQIQLVIAGRGPKGNQLKRYADKLLKKGIIAYAPRFGFLDLAGLQNYAATSDLFVHCAYIEVEGLSCMEAIQTGLVPIIAKGRYTATSQFALDPESTFQARKPKLLARRIDYWLSHEKERHEEAAKYVGLGQNYSIDKSIKAIIEMFNDAIAMAKNKTK
jgi:1,2-diacylglycerol 3-alpha-glucosyltransferase